MEELSTVSGINKKKHVTATKQWGSVIPADRSRQIERILARMVAEAYMREHEKHEQKNAKN